MAVINRRSTPWSAEDTRYAIFNEGMDGHIDDVANFSDRNRKIVRMYINGMSTSEIAKEMDMRNQYILPVIYAFMRKCRRLDFSKGD